MAAVDILAAFGYKWAETGTVEALDDAQYKAGWAFIGATPPSVEQFNKVHQIADEKANYLYAQMLSVFNSAGMAPSPGVSDTLLNSVASLFGAGRVTGVQGFYSSGTFTKDPETNSGIVLISAGGGGGGAGPITAAGQVGVGSGGGSGTFALCYFGALNSGPVVVGAGGAGGVPNASNILSAGSVGGSSTFGGVTCPGGVAGLSAGPANPPFNPQGTGQGSPATNGGSAFILLNAPGGPGGLAIPIGVSAVAGGVGAPSAFGGGGNTNSGDGPGATSLAFSAGGGGGVCGPSSSAGAGGSGGPGYVVFIELS